MIFYFFLISPPVTSSRVTYLDGRGYSGTLVSFLTQKMSVFSIADDQPRRSSCFFLFFLNRRLKPNTCWVLVLMTGFKRIITHLFLGFLPHLVLLTLQGESFSQHGKLNGQRKKKYLRNDWDKEGKCYTRVKFIRISCFVPFYIYIMPCPHSRSLYKSIQMPAFEKL